MWVWVNSGSWWWTGRQAVLLYMGSQRVGHDWATELTKLTAIFHKWLFSLWEMSSGLLLGIGNDSTLDYKLPSYHETWVAHDELSGNRWLRTTSAMEGLAWKGLHWNRCLFWVWNGLPCPWYFCQSQHLLTYKYFTHHHAFIYSIASDQWGICTSKEVRFLKINNTSGS